MSEGRKLKLLDLSGEAVTHFENLSRVVYEIEKESGENVDDALNALTQFAGAMGRITTRLRDRFPDPKGVVEDLFKDLRNPDDTPPEA